MLSTVGYAAVDEPPILIMALLVAGYTFLGLMFSPTMVDFCYAAAADEPDACYVRTLFPSK